MRQFVISDWILALKYFKRDLQKAKEGAEVYADSLKRAEDPDMIEHYTQRQLEFEEEVSDLKYLISIIENREA